MISSKDATDWSGDRIERMIRTRRLEEERGALSLLKNFSTPALVGDFGSGIGRRHCYFPDSKYIGFDREEIMIENARKYFPNLDIRESDITEVDIRYPEMAGRFDMILTFAVVQYNFLEEQRRIYECIHRCLKDSGLYYWRENKENASIPSEILPDLFVEVAFDGDAQRVFRKL